MVRWFQPGNDQPSSTFNIPGLVNVNKKRWKDPPFSMGKSTISTGSFSIVMLNYQRVSRLDGCKLKTTLFVDPTRSLLLNRPQWVAAKGGSMLGIDDCKSISARCSWRHSWAPKKHQNIAVEAIHRMATTWRGGRITWLAGILYGWIWSIAGWDEQSALKPFRMCSDGVEHKFDVEMIYKLMKHGDKHWLMGTFQRLL